MLTPLSPPPLAQPAVLGTDPDAGEALLVVELGWTGQHVNVVVTGELDIATADLLKSLVEGAIHLRSARQVTADLAGIRFIDAAGVTALLCIQRTAAAVGAGLIIGHASPVVQRILGMTGLLGHFGLSGAHRWPFGCPSKRANTTV